MKRIALVLASLTIAGGALAPPLMATDELSVSRLGNTLTVSGAASITNASKSVVGSDATGDASQAGVGGDLTTATVERGPNETLRFTVGVADPMANTFTLPEAMHYHWQIQVFNGNLSIHYLLQAMRTGQYERTLPSADTLFRVNSCSALASGAPNCFEVAGYVTGTMANGIVQWNVPRALIGAFDGAVIALGPNGLRAVGGASGAAYGVPVFDRIEGVDAYVVGPAVAIGVRPVEQEPAPFAYHSPAAVGPDGSFVGKLAAPVGGGDYEVSVRSCNGALATCGFQGATFTI